MNYFPAAPGTLVATRDPDAVHGISYTPVVGWCHIQANIAFPILAMAFGGMTHGKAIVSPDGFVTDPTHRLVFANIEEWAAFIDHTKAPAEKTETAAATPAPETEQAFSGKINFGEKSFSTKSFWKVPDIEALFIVEGGEVYPKDKRAEKVKRDDFMSLKKDGWSVIDPRSGVVEEPTEEAPEEGDDGMDLV